MEQPNLQIGSSYEALQGIFQLKVGDTTAPFETPNGYQIVKMKEKKEGYVPDYNQAKDKVIDAWKLGEAKKLAKQKAEEELAAIKNAFKEVRRPDFAATAKSLGLELQQTPIFSRNEYLPNLGISKEFQEVAFSLNEDNRLVDNAVETLRGYAILYLDSKQPIDEKDYEKHKQEIANALLTEKRNAGFSEFLTQLRLKANLQDNISDVINRRERS
jgi:parvulin-like peptidyl-prolyl isomerase